MEKYGVDEGKPEGQKQASDMSHCPKCDKELTKHGRLRLCPTHGSQPFERKNE